MAKLNQLLKKLYSKDKLVLQRTQLKLAYLYMLGTEDVKIDIEKTMQYLNAAAEGGNARAQWILGMVFDESFPSECIIKNVKVSKSNVVAKMWYAKALGNNEDFFINDIKERAEAGSIPAKEAIQEIEKNNHQKKNSKDVGSERKIEHDSTEDSTIESQISGNLPDSIKELLKKAKGWLGRGDAVSQFTIGNAYLKGLDVDKNEKIAFLWFEKAANQGHRLSQFYLGMMYENGLGVDKNEKRSNEKQAFAWYEKAAEQGHIEAAFHLAVLIEEAGFALQDDEEAVKWYKKAAKKGHAKAQYHLGTMYQFGAGVKKNNEEALKWYKKAAEQNDAKAQNSIGDMYKNGWGVEENDDIACEWYLKAAKQGDSDAEFNLGFMYLQGYGVSQNYKDAVMWFGKAAKKEHAAGEFYLGFMYKTGRGIGKDIEKAHQCFFNSAELGDENAQNEVGIMYEYGHGVPRDDKKAYEWYLKAAEQGLDEAQYRLGLCYKNAIGVEKDIQIAYNWFLKAAKQDCESAQNALGYMYHTGLGVDTDYKEAYEWYSIAAKRGFAKAQYYLGVLYEDGHGVCQDMQIAYEWFEKAAKQGIEVAQEKLEKKAKQVLVPVINKNELKTKKEGTIKVKGKLEERRGCMTRVLNRITQYWYMPSNIQILQDRVDGLSETLKEKIRSDDNWKKGIMEDIFNFSKQMIEVQRKLGFDLKTKLDQDTIDKNPKLKAYQNRLEMEFNCFVTCYFLAATGIFKIENNIDTLISVLSHIPKKAIQGIPFVGPLLSSFVEGIEAGAHKINKQHYLLKINNVRELFSGLTEISNVASKLARELTLKRKEIIDNQREVLHKRLKEVGEFYENAKLKLNNIVQGLPTSDKTGVELSKEETFAVQDCAFLMKEILTGHFKKNISKDYVEQFIDIVLCKNNNSMALLRATS